VQVEQAQDTALDLYAGPLLADCYDEWAQLEQERLHLRYLAALESRGHRRYEARRWDAALADASTLLTADPLNETAARLVMACHWALGQREAARRCYDAFRQRVRHDLQADPLPETIALYQRILRGEPHPDQVSPPADRASAAQAAHLSLLETLGAFRQGLEQATAWAAEASGPALAEALRWQGCFHLRLGQLAESRAVLAVALPLAGTPDQQVIILANLATAETGLGDYQAAEAHYSQAVGISPMGPAARARLLGCLGGLQGRMGRLAEACRTLEEAVRLARELGDPAPLAMASGNLAILLIGQQETATAEAVLREALAAARHADAHWLTAHLTGHLGVLAQDRGDFESAAQSYQSARVLTETIGDRRGTLLWTLNLGIVRYEQGRCAEALPLLAEGLEQAVAQGCKGLEAGARIFLGACLAAHGEEEEGLRSIERGQALAQAIGDQERLLMGHLQHGRALAALGRHGEAIAALQDGLCQAEASQMHRLEEFLQAEMERVKRVTSNE
jgi:tetratricopeptide (TPR) repeat protein